MRNRTDVVIGVLLVTLLAWALLEAQDWPARTRFFPLIIGYPMLVLAAIHLGYSLWLGLRPAGPWQALEEPEPEMEAGPPLDPAVVRRRTLEISRLGRDFRAGPVAPGIQGWGGGHPSGLPPVPGPRALGHQRPVQPWRLRVLLGRPGAGPFVSPASRPPRRRLGRLLLRFLPDGPDSEPVPVSFARFGKDGRVSACS